MHGDGLHLAIGWLIVAALTAATGLWHRIGNVRLSHAGVVDRVVIALLMAGFGLSTWHVFRVHGDRRSALNLAIEWFAIGAVWWIVRRVMRNVKARQWIVTLLIAIGVGTACIGIAQHHVSHGRQAKWYQQLRSRIDGGGVDAVVATQELKEADVPLNGTSRELFERRLLASSEPIGPFALANTLGGLLAVALVLIVGGLVQVLRDQTQKVSLWSWSVLVIMTFLLGYCLLLTKSRTAWVGLCCGAGMLFLQGRALLSSGRMKRVLLVTLSVLTLGAAIGIGSGAIDKEVVLESPRSLQFRLFYWIGAAGVIADEPIFGAGPGNFRSMYLAHKVVESSEEILDPHNILLDAWCSAGVIGVAALCLMLVTIVSRSLAVDQSDQLQPVHAAADRSVRPALRLGIVGGLLLHLGWRWLNGGEFIDMSRDLFDSANLVIVIPLAGLLSVEALFGRILISGSVIRAAFVCLFVHLLGAGGLQISGLGLLLILLHALSADGDSEAASTDTASRFFWGWLPVSAFTVMATLAVWQGFLPVVAASRHAEVAAMLRLQSKPEAAIREFDRAIRQDPYDVKLRQRKMEVLSYVFVAAVDRYALWEQESIEQVDDLLALFDRASFACDQVITADQRSYSGYYFRSRLGQQRYRVRPDAELEEQVLSDMEQVLSRYPENSRFWLEYAKLLDEFERSGRLRESAVRALEIDAVNHNWGHIDRYLPQDQVQWLAGIIDSK